MFFDENYTRKLHYKLLFTAKRAPPNALNVGADPTMTAIVINDKQLRIYIVLETQL